MIKTAIIFFVIAIISYLSGINNFMGIDQEMGRLLLFLFVSAAILSYIGAIFIDDKKRI